MPLTEIDFLNCLVNYASLDGLQTAVVKPTDIKINNDSGGIGAVNQSSTLSNAGVDFQYLYPTVSIDRRAFVKLETDYVVIGGLDNSISGYVGAGIALQFGADKPLVVNNSCGDAGQVLTSSGANLPPNWTSIPLVYPQVVVIDLSANYTITGINNPVYNLWAKTSAAGQQTIFLPTSGMTIGQTIIIRSEADSSSINSGTGNLIYRSITASESVVISQASCVQFCLGSIEGSVYNWFVVSTS